MSKFAISRDGNGVISYGLAFADDKYSATLTASTATALTVPVDLRKGIAIFSYTPGASVWVAKNLTAAVPAGNTFASVTSELNPVAREVIGGDTLSFITADNAIDVGVTFYAME